MHKESRKNVIMKRLLLIFCAAFTVSNVSAQALETSLSAAFAVGTGSNFTKAGFMAEVGFMPKIAPKVQIGGQVGFLLLPGAEVESGNLIDVNPSPNQNFISVAAAARIDIAKGFKVQADLGYAFGVNKTNQFSSPFGIPIENVNGFYYSPKVLYQLAERFLVMLAYRGIALDGFEWQVITFGLTLRII